MIPIKADSILVNELQGLHLLAYDNSGGFLCEKLGWITEYSEASAMRIKGKENAAESDRIPPRLIDKIFGIVRREAHVIPLMQLEAN